ncbi:uncharacterized protein LOC126336551 [Schistocerca gregaria]|uniref:uncharacterized protein LOC126336551 n=1 Tax=Schistocerca gregaria TaxID=7010 RepID=UPI00211E027C|nr:uncharacterized protein LOC126336551 [Schistocerca gregaria]XP_049856342.1 uncharacterized protein LOC126336551 [Schistocerca gregaria]XP_049856344.1 uncharacterized protein LOC126336551 [Schistocerca gregaria]
MTAITSQLSFYSPVQCLPPSIDTSNYTTESHNSTEISRLQLLIDNKEELCDLNIDVNAEGDDSSTRTSLVNATVCDRMSYGFIVNENSIVSGIDLKQSNQLIQAEKQGETTILYPESKDKESDESEETDGLEGIRDSEKSVKDSCTVQLDSSPNYTYTIDAEKMVSSLCNSSNTKEDSVELQSEKTVKRKHCVILQNAGSCVNLHGNCNCNKPEGFLEKPDDAGSFEAVTDVSSSVPTASLVFSSTDNFVPENYKITKQCSSPMLSDSGCAEEASSFSVGSKCESLTSNPSGDVLNVPNQCDTVCLNEYGQKISVSCQTEHSDVHNELQYTEKIAKLSEEILQTLSSIPPSPTVQAIAEICLSMKNRARENNVKGNISENVMNNLVLSFLHVASSWMFLSSCNGLKSIVHLCHPPLHIIFNKWEANSLTLLDYMINFISETRKCVTNSWNKQILNGVFKQSDGNCNVFSMMHQSNYMNLNPSTNFNSTTPVNLSTEGTKLFNEDLKLHNKFLFDCSGAVSSNPDNTLASETQRVDTFKSDLLSHFSGDKQKENNLGAPTFTRELPQFNSIAQNKTAHSLNPETLDVIKNVDFQLPGLLPSKEQSEKNNINLPNEMSSNSDNKSSKFQTSDTPIKNWRNLNQQTLESYLQMQRQQTAPDDMLGMLHTNTESLNEAEQNYFAAEAAEGSSLWIKSANQQPIVLHGNSAHYPHNNNGYYLNVHFPQTNDMYNASFLPITKKLSNNRKKYHRFRFSTVANTKSTSYNRNYNFKKSNVRGNKGKTFPVRIPLDSDSSDENNEAVYMKPGSYVVPMKHVQDLRDFIPQYAISQVVTPKNESSVVGNRENANNDRIWKTACASAAVFLQMVQERNGFDVSCKNQSLSSDLKESGEKPKLYDSSEIPATEVTSSLSISSSSDERNELQIKSENHSDLQTQGSCVVCNDSNMENNQTTAHSAGSTFSEPTTEVKTQDVKAECEETIPLDSMDSELHRQSISTAHSGISQLLKDAKDHRVPRKSFCKHGTPQYNNRSLCYKQHGLNHDEIAKLKSILNCIWNMEGSDFIKYPYTSEKVSENEKSSDGCISLQTVAYKLQNHLYSSIDQFVYDFHRIFHKSKDNNKEDHQSSEVSSTLCKKFDNLIEEQFCGLNFKFISGSYSQNAGISCTRNNFLDHHKKHNKKNSFKVSSPKKSDAPNVDTTVK